MAEDKSSHRQTDDANCEEDRPEQPKGHFLGLSGRSDGEGKSVMTADLLWAR
jgi:putative protein kinase ArgK-like GTPase of G3E family